jgi:hypothetical protein
MNPAQFQALREMEPDRIKAYWKKHAYVEELPDNIGPFKQLLQEYSKVPAGEVDELLRRTVSLVHRRRRVTSSTANAECAA